MTKSLMKAALRSATCLSIVAFSSTAVLAQDAAPPAAEDDAAADTIIVTGSRISRPDLKSTVPIAFVDGDTIMKQGNTNIGDTLNDLPQLRTSRAQQNSSTGVGISGLNLLDLRGLGTARTLVLVNGRRHVGADILNNAVSVDTNTIPANLIQRIDIVTGGESAVYGSDAIAGVVNFILKKNFEGLEVGAKGAVSTPGSYGLNYHGDVLWGKNFADGRGNITLSFDYNHQNRVYASQVPWLRSVEGLILTDSDPAGLPLGSDGVYDSTYQYDIRQTSIHVNGLVPVTQGTVGAACGIGVTNGVTPGTPYNCTYIFGSDGSLAPQTGTRYGTGVIGAITGGNGQTGREGILLTVLPRQDIYNFNMLGHYEFSDAVDFFWEGKYTRINSFGGNAGTSSIQGVFNQFDYRERVRLDNPYLNAAARTTIANAVLASGCNTSINTACNVVGVASTSVRATGGGQTVQGVSGPLNAADIAAIAAGTYRFVIARNLDDLGSRDESFLRQTYRAVVGLRGTFNSDWKYEVAFNYGRFTERTNATGYVDRQRFMLAMDAGRNPTTGTIECRAKFDPAAQVAYSATTAPRLAADIAACVPYNPFGKSDNSAASRYFGVSYSNVSWMTQKDVSGFVAGNTAGFLNLPGGPIDFVLGGEYREEDAQYDQDAFAAAGNTTAVAFGSFAPDPFKVTEGFGELRIPIFKDKPLLEELTLHGAARISHYNSGAGTVWAWNAGGDYSPLPGVRFRANYSRSIRAPNLAETFGPLVPNFAPGFTDPCSSARISTGTQFRAANCATDLGTLIGNLASLGSYSLPILSGVNPNLEAEKSSSLTIGAVVQPRAIPGLTLTLDYYSIRVNGVIVSLTAQNIANSCYDQPTLSNPFCGLFTRYRASGAGPFGEVTGQILGNSLISAPFNFAKRIRRGLDTQLDYATNFGDGFKLRANVYYSHQFKNSNFENPTLPDFENRILGELGDPVDEAKLTLEVSKGPYTFGYEARYIGPMWVGNYESFNTLQDRPAQDIDSAEVPNFPAVLYHNIRFQWDMEKSGIGKGLELYAGVDNVFNKTPPLGASGVGGGGGGGANERPGSQNSNGAVYNVRGRQFYMGARAKF